MSNWARHALMTGLQHLRGGTLRLERAGQSDCFGTESDLAASLTVHDDRFFSRALTAADIGIGESYMDGEWTSPDLVTLGRLLLRNRHVLSGGGRWMRTVKSLAGAWARRQRDNSISGSRQHIHRHYDLGNDFFALFLDARLRMYSCAYFDAADEALETAQARKVDRICARLSLKPGDHVLEIGSGWGGFAEWAASRYGCRVTTTTISDEQYRHVQDWRARAGEPGSRVDVLRADYRELRGRFDKIVSIEMFEAVGLKHYDDFFGAADRLLAPGGTMLMQTITVDDQWFPHYHGQPDWIEKHIFPGGELASLGEIVQSLGRSTSLSIYHAENFGTHYARTLHEWRRRFHQRIDQVRALGFDERFIRMWDFYLAICEAAFLERHCGLFQLMFVKNGSQQQLFNEPWPAAAAPTRVTDAA